MTIKKIFVCNKCAKEYKSKASFEKHECVQVYECKECGFKTVHESMMQKHKCPTYTLKDEKTKVTCPYCNASFARESTLIGHMCKKKERYLNKNTKETLLAFEMWSKFRQVMQLRLAADAIPMDVFLSSYEFEGFYKFAKYSLETKFLNPIGFMNDALKEGISIDIWTTWTERKKWVIKYLKTENATSAVERSIVTVNAWAEKTNNNWKDFFKSVSPARLLQLVSNGEISPWFIYASSTYEEALNRLSDSEFVELFEYIDPKIWKVKQQKSKEEFKHLSDVCMEFGI